MSHKQTTLSVAVIIVLGVMNAGIAGAGVFGELHLGLGGTFPQGTYARYVDPGFVVDLRGTIHIPNAEFLAAWVDFNYIIFAQESIESEGKVTVGPITTYFPVMEKYSEELYTGHVGIQLASTTQRAAFRPRAGIGIGLYNFQTDLTWEAEFPDTTVKIANLDLDSQTCFGWRAIMGADFFFTPQFGASIDFLYDHVFNVERVEGTEEVERTSRFLGFTAGFVYMFKTE
ncbi:MAG: hypothetical protein ABIA59_09815 [Candidatus Latescibacterota bacterium]